MRPAEIAVESMVFDICPPLGYFYAHRARKRVKRYHLTLIDSDSIQSSLILLINVSQYINKDLSFSTQPEKAPIPPSDLFQLFATIKTKLRYNNKPLVISMFTDSPTSTGPKISLSFSPEGFGIQIKTFPFPQITLDPELHFQASDYGIQTRGNRASDLTVRDSSYAFSEIPGIMEYTHQFLINYFKEFKAEPELNKEWRVLKYQNGHFDWHSDHEKQHKSMEHLGTELLLPPESQCAYNGGELDIQFNAISMVIRPDPIDWTHIILPLGIRHRVRRVEGVRYSFTKPIFYRSERDKSWMSNRYMSYRFDQ